MSVIIDANKGTIEERVALILEGLEEERRTGEGRKRSEQLVREYEAKYGMRSEDVWPAVVRGEMEETLEVCDWLMEYNSVKRAHARTGE